MKFHLSSLLLGFSFMSVSAFGQAKDTNSLKQVDKAWTAEQAAKADVYIVKKSLGNTISEPADSVTVKPSGAVKKSSTRKTRKVSCSSKNYKHKKA